MTEFDWNPPGSLVDDPFGFVEPTEVLHEFDGPRFFTFTTQTGLYLAYLCDEIQGSFRHVIVPTTNRTVLQLKDGSCPIRDALVQEQDRMWIADMDGEGRFKAVWHLTSLDFPEDVLPMEGVKLYPESDETENKPEEITFGQDGKGLRLHVRWPDATEKVDGIVHGELFLWADKTLAWGTCQGGTLHPLRFNMVRFLRFLGDNWPSLLYQENMNHNLSEGLDGEGNAALTLTKEGHVFSVQAERYRTSWDYQETLGVLEKFGVWIAQHIDTTPNQEAQTSLSVWNSRNDRANQQHRSLASGLEEERIQKVWPKNVIPSNDEWEEPLCMAARMVGGFLNDEQLVFLLSLISKIGKTNSKVIKTITKVRKQLEKTATRTDDIQQQGMNAANALRDYLKIGQNKETDPEKVLMDWGMTLELYNSNSPVDAVSVWGGKSGLAILLNQSGPRVIYPSGRKFTLAHEMAHLLLDMEGFRPVGDVFHSARLRTDAEKRANAFAAEFLLPEKAVRECLETFDEKHSNVAWKDNDQEKQRLLNEIAADFNVSHELTAWKIIHTEFFDNNQVVFFNRSLNSVNNPY